MLTARKDFYSLLPRRILLEIDSIALSRVGEISEIRLRKGGRNSVTVGGERIFLSGKITALEMDEYFKAIIGESMYAYRDTLSGGYISLDGGVRIGVVGSASYDGARLVGISNVSSLCIRIPSPHFVSDEKIYEAFKMAKTGLLVYSPPGEGKTSALRYLAELLSSSKIGMNVAVIDERLEFSEIKNERLSLDILSGYKKTDGLEIALRTLAPEVVIVDEIGGENEALGMLPFVNSGVRIIASAHAFDFEELRRKKNIAPFFSFGVFDAFLSIKRLKNDFYYEAFSTYD